jgi:hypothetical protein
MEVADAAAEFSVTSTAAAGAVAAVSHAAVTGKSHYITAIHASFDAAHIDLLILAFDGTATRHQVHNARDFEFSNPVKVASATAATASLNVTSFNGDLTIRGFTA